MNRLTRLRGEQLEDRRLLTINYVEPVGETNENDTFATAVQLNLGFDMVNGQDTDFTVSGRREGSIDIDTFAFQLNAGDIITIDGRIPGLWIYDTNDVNNPVFLSRLKTSWFTTRNPDSPIANKDVWFMAPETGSFGIEIRPLSAGSSSKNYSLELQLHRPGMESKPSATKQIIYVDLDGVDNVIPAELFENIGNTNAVDIPGLSEFVSQWGLDPENDTVAIENEIMSTVSDNITDILTPGFEVSIQSSQQGDPSGQPNVSRIIVGGSCGDIGGSCGTPLSMQAIVDGGVVDPGNYLHEDQGLVLLSRLAGFLLSLVEIQPGLEDDDLRNKKIELIGTTIGNFVSYEIGLLLGLPETDITSQRGIMQLNRNGFPDNIPFASGLDGSSWGNEPGDPPEIDLGYRGISTVFFPYTHDHEKGVPPFPDPSTIDVQKTLNFGLSTGKVVGTPPAQPTNFRLIPTQDEVHFLWDDVSNETGYRLYLRDDGENVTTATLVATLNADQTTAVVTGLPTDTRMFFLLEAFNADGSAFNSGTWRPVTTVSFPRRSPTPRCC